MHSSGINNENGDEAYHAEVGYVVCHNKPVYHGKMALDGKYVY